MKYQIMLACMSGFSTSMLVKKMLSAAKDKNIDVEIDAVAETELDKYDGIDIILLGPQVSYLLDELKSKFSVSVLVIDLMDYGLMNGEKVLQDVLDYLNSNQFIS